MNQMFMAAERFMRRVLFCLFCEQSPNQQRASTLLQEAAQLRDRLVTILGAKLKLEEEMFPSSKRSVPLPPHLRSRWYYKRQENPICYPPTSSERSTAGILATLTRCAGGKVHMVATWCVAKAGTVAHQPAYAQTIFNLLAPAA